MNRYSVLYGTAKAGVYQELESSKGLAQFLKKLGAESTVLSKVEVSKIMTGFCRKDDYFKEKQENAAPVALRYAPMHLRKLPTMPKNMLPFCALSVNGIERREEINSNDKRETFFSQTFYIGRELMQKSSVEGLCYLDQIFGTKLISGKDMQDYILGRAPIELDTIPSRVVPIYREQDKMLVLRVLELLYLKKTVVIKLEKECSVNSRSRELLVQIYSMMQSRLATEYGFSTYSDQEDIAMLTSRTSVKLFLVPAEAMLGEMPVDTILIDLNVEKTFKPLSPELHEMLSKWYALKWEQRREAMEILFDDDQLDYTDVTSFLRISRDFFNNYAELVEWEEDMGNEGTVGTLAELRRIKEKFPICSIGWCDQIFKKKVPKLMKAGVSLEGLVAKISETICYAWKMNLPTAPKDAEDFKFSRTLEVKDTTKYFYGAAIDHWDSDSSKRIEELVAGHAAEQAAITAQHKEEISQKDAKLRECNQAIERLKANHITELDNLKAQHAIESQNLKVLHEKELTDLKTQYASEVEGLNAKHIAEINNLTARAKREIAGKDQEIQELSVKVQRHAEEIREVERRARTAESEKATLQNRVSDLEDKVRRMESRGYTDVEPENPKKKWIMAGIGMAAGMLLIGLIWLLVALIGGGGDKIEATTPTVEIVETTIPTTVPTTVPKTVPTEPTTEATTVPTEPEPVEFMGWDDPALAEHMLISVDGVEQVAADDSWYADDIAIPEGYTVMAAVSSEEEGTFTGYPDSYALILSIAQVGENENNIVDSEEDASNSGISNGESDTEPDETNTDGEYNSSTSDSEVDTEPTEEDNGRDNRNTESTTEATEEAVPVEPLTTEEWFALSDRIQLVIETENQVILSVGTDKMHEVAFRTAAWSAANEYIDIHITVRLEDGDLLDLTEGVRPLLRTKYGGSYWWYVLEDFSTESAHMAQLQTILNTNRCPILSFKYLGNEIVAFDYQGDVDMAAKLEEDIDAKAVGDIVYALAPHSSNSTETSTEALDPTETSYNVGGMN